MKGRDLAVGLSLANLWLFPTWAELLFTGPSVGYYMLAPVAPVDYLAAIVAMLLLGGTFTALMTAARASRSPRILIGAKCVFLLALLVPLNSMRLELPPELGVGAVFARARGNPIVLALLALLSLAGLAAAAVWRRRLFTVASGLVAILAPLCLMSSAQALMAAGRPEPPYVTPKLEGAPISQTGTVTPPLVLWIVFDELDQSMAFSRRPEGLALPELDRLQQQAWMADHAYAPARSTRLSIPALITGRLVARSKPFDPMDTRLEFADGKGTLATSEHIFKRARQAGARTAVVGWYHPYCRLFGAYLDECFYYPVFQTISGQHEAADKTLFGAVADQLQATLPYDRRRLAVNAYLKLREEAIRSAEHTTHGLLYMHLPTPHMPAIFDRKRDQLTKISMAGLDGYLDNLTLTDRTLGAIRAGMERAGTWDGAYVMISSDHIWRDAQKYDGRTDPFIPFIIKLPGQREGVRFEPETNTVISADLVLALLAGELQTTEALGAWVQSHTTVTRSPFDKAGGKVAQ